MVSEVFIDIILADLHISNNQGSQKWRGLICRFLFSFRRKAIFEWVLWRAYTNIINLVTPS